MKSSKPIGTRSLIYFWSTFLFSLNFRHTHKKNSQGKRANCRVEGVWFSFQAALLPCLALPEWEPLRWGERGGRLGRWAIAAQALGLPLSRCHLATTCGWFSLVAPAACVSDFHALLYFDSFRFSLLKEKSSLWGKYDSWCASISRNSFSLTRVWRGYWVQSWQGLIDDNTYYFELTDTIYGHIYSSFLGFTQ